jgi:hypothetical protein
MRFRHRCALERTARHLGCIPAQRIEIESLTTDARTCLSIQAAIVNTRNDSNPETNSCKVSISDFQADAQSLVLPGICSSDVGSGAPVATGLVAVLR